MSGKLIPPADIKCGAEVRELTALVLQQVIPDGFPPPAFYPGDDVGSLNMYWPAGPRQVEIEVSGGDLPVYLRVVDGDGVTIANEEQPANDLRLESARRVLAEIADLIREKNRAR